VRRSLLKPARPCQPPALRARPSRGRHRQTPRETRRTQAAPWRASNRRRGDWRLPGGRPAGGTHRRDPVAGPRPRNRQTFARHRVARRQTIRRVSQVIPSPDEAHDRSPEKQTTTPRPPPNNWPHASRDGHRGRAPPAKWVIQGRGRLRTPGGRHRRASGNPGQTRRAGVAPPDERAEALAARKGEEAGSRDSLRHGTSPRLASEPRTTRGPRRPA